jgi:TolB-like protein/class 3 adenylate cyclase/Flp pilus assembly protein TadD
MSIEIKKEIQLEIAHVLFIDIVGYSKLAVNEQRALIERLNDIVRATDEFQAAETTGRLMKIPTGDGMALVFYHSPEAPVDCALEISRALKNHLELRLRMGVHSGPISGVVDLNGKANVAGAGINMAQRVMDCGDAGHILVSKHVAEDLEQYPHWRPHLHDLGETEVKHGIRLSVVNLYTEELGNAAVPEKVKATRVGAAARERAVRRRQALAVAALLAAAAAICFVMLRNKGPLPSAGSAIPEKSIAVLPFDNLSRDPENAYFSEGIQDEILTRLAKIAELKVISRTSTQRFKSAPGDLRQIAQQLGVANILEGSVQKPSDQVRVNVQLIHAATDTHLWAEIYDRKLTDVFAVESEIAKAIAERLQAKLTGSAEHVLASRPTENPKAHELYLKGRYFWNKRTTENLKKAIDYFEQAIGEDPAYALAYSGLADAHAVLPFYSAISPKDDAREALAAARKAVELDESLAEAHTSLANALVLNLQFSASVPEFQRALELNPNYATAHHWYGELLQNDGRFEEAVAELRRAQELDPLSLVINSVLGSTLAVADRNDEAIEQLSKTIEIDPTFDLAHWFLGQAYENKAHLAEAIDQYEKAMQLNPDPAVLASLARAYALAGSKQNAYKILDTLTTESRQRYIPAYSLAVIHLALGDKEEALRLLEKSYQDRAPFDTGVFGSIKIDRRLDPLRGDPRFQSLVWKAMSGGVSGTP